MKRDAHAILIKPLLTEKSTALREANHKISFVVHRWANKIEVRRAVEEALKVRVQEVNLINVRGKPKRFGMSSGRRSDWKKAIITLKKGEKLDIFEGS